MISSRYGGPVASTLGVTEALIDAGHDVTVFSTTLGKVPWSGDWRKLKAEEMPPNAEALDLELFDVASPHRLVYSPELGRRLTAVIGDYDVVHIHSLWLYPAFAAQRAARRAGVPYVVTPHGALDPYLRKHGRPRKAIASVLWQKKMLNNAAMLHITTEEEGELIADIAPRVPRTVVPNGIWLDQFSQADGDGPRFRAGHLDGFDGPLVMFFGRVTFKKGIDVLIRSFAEVTGRHPEARLAIVGPDDEGLTDGLRDLTASLGITEKVVFTGPMYAGERADALAAADVWALSSYTENFGIAVVEAMAAGVPTVISPAVNLAPAISDARAGLVAEADPVEFGAAIDELLDLSELRADIGRRGLDFAASYDWRSVVPRMVEMYSDCARQKRQ